MILDDGSVVLRSHCSWLQVKSICDWYLISLPNCGGVYINIVCVTFQAAKVLIEGFEADISDIAKDCMRPRAKKIAHQKNIHLDDNTRQTLLAFSTKETIMENNIPSIHFYKQPLE